MRLYGATYVYELNTTLGPISIVAENHGIQSNVNCNLGDYLKRYRTLCKNEVACWLEIEEWERSNSSVTPLRAAALLRNQKHIVGLSDIAFRSINIRRRSPFLILESFLHYSNFINIVISLAPDVEIDKQFRQICMEFEKSCLTHISSREAFRGFVMQLIHPDLSLPKWYIDTLDKFNKLGVIINTNENDIKRLLARLSKIDLDTVVEFTKWHLDNIIESNTDYGYSKAMEEVLQTLQSKSSKMVIEKYQNLQALFIHAFAIIMDIYIISLLILEPEKAKVLVLGYQHADRIFAFLANTKRVKSGYTFYSHRAEFVDITQTKDTMLTRFRRAPAFELLAKFREERIQRKRLK